MATVKQKFIIDEDGDIVSPITSTESVYNSSGTSMIDYIYPVGSIYMSMNSTSPATLFGGTWTQLKDRFLLSVGDTYTSVNATGGASTVTLTSSEMPSHTHSISAHTHSFSATTGSTSHTHTVEGTTSSDGLHSHNTKQLDNLTNTGVNNYARGWENTGEISEGTDEQGEHTHTFSATTSSNSHTHTVEGTTGSTSLTTASTGSGSAHNNMPPYITVYMWYRVS